MQNDPILEFLSQLPGVTKVIPMDYPQCRRMNASLAQRRVTPETPNAATPNQEMANKINELYNELNQKEHDLGETRKALRSLQDTLLDFRRRAEHAEQDAAAARKSYNELSAAYNKLLDSHRAVKAALNAAKNQTPVASADLAFPGTKDKTAVSTPDVDAIDIPLSTAEDIINTLLRG